MTTSGRALVVDPRRYHRVSADADRYGLAIEGVINTHFHADFVSGHLELVEATGGWIGFGRRQTEYPIRRAADGEHVSLGEVDLEILPPQGIPGNRSACSFASGRRAAGCRVDRRFVHRGCRRPDLVNLGDGSSVDLARAMYSTIHRRLLRLPNHVVAAPAHGADHPAARTCRRN